MLREMRTLLSFTGKGGRFLVLLLLRSPFEAARFIANALFMQYAFTAIQRGDGHGLALACLAFGIASACLFLYNGTIWSLYAPFTACLEGRLRLELFSKIASLSCARVEAAPPGDWVTRLNTDTQLFFSQPLHLPHAACAIVSVGVSSIILLRLDPAILACVLLFVAPHILTTQLLVARTMPGLKKKALEATATNTGDLAALITCADIAALYEGQGFLLKRFEQSSLALRRANMRIKLRQALSAAFIPLFSLSGYLVLLMLAGSRIAAGSMTFGDFMPVFSYRGGVLVGSLMLVDSLVNIQGSRAGIRRLNETLTEKAEEGHG